MAKKKKIKPSAMEEAREDLPIFPGGLPIKLSQKIGNEKLEDKLQSFIYNILDDELRSQETLIDKLEKSQKQYRGERDAKSLPWIGCSNISIPLTRWLVDNIATRLITTIFGQKKIFVLQARKSEFVDMIDDLEDGLEWWAKWIVDLETVLFDPIQQCIKTGTGIVKIDYEIKKDTKYRYATQEEIDDKDTKKYKTDGDPLVKIPVSKYQGPTIYPIPREDFIISSEAKSIDTAFLCGFRKYLRKPQIEARVIAGLYRKDVISNLYEGETPYSGDKYDDVKKDRAEGQGKEISEEKEKPIEIWELWFKYDIDGDGIEDDIVVIWHQNTKTILRAIFNPDFYGHRPFMDFVFNPVEYAFDGEGLCNILRDLQDEVDELHNQRIDNGKLMNTLSFIELDGAISEEWVWYPGCRIKVADVESSIKQLEVGKPLASSFQEEGQSMGYAQLVSGVSLEAMGQATSERPVASETMTRLQQVGIKTKFGADIIRRKLTHMAMKALCQIGQYQPRFTYEVENKDGLFQESVVNFPSAYLEEGIKIDLMASSDMMNTEVRREINIAVYQMLTDYLTNLASMVQTLVSQSHPEMKKFILFYAESGRKVVTRILEDFEITDAEDLLKPLDKIIDVPNAIKNPLPPQTEPTEGTTAPTQGPPEI